MHSSCKFTVLHSGRLIIRTTCIIPTVDTSKAFSECGIYHFYRQDIGKVGVKFAENGMRYTYGTENFLIFNLVNGKNTKRSRDIGKNNSGEI